MTCPNGDPTCTSRDSCASCGKHLCTDWATVYDPKTGRVYCQQCGNKRGR